MAVIASLITPDHIYMFLQLSKRWFENESFNQDYVCYSILQLTLFSLLYNLVFVASVVCTQPRRKKKTAGFGINIMLSWSTRGLLLQCTSNMPIELSMLVWYNLYIIIISWNVTCCPHDINGPFCLILGKTTIPHSYVINIKWKITNTTLSAQCQHIRIFFQWMVYMFKMRSSMIPIIYVCSTLSVSERGKLCHTYNMCMT
jgi:hypothetical protein